MTQAQRKETSVNETPQGETEVPKVDPKLSGFVTALETVKRAALAYGEGGEARKEAGEALQKAQRIAAWEAFDYADAIRQGGDTEKAIATGETLALQIADARGVKEEAKPVYAQRGRDMVSQFPEAMRGVDRAKKDPLTLAKTLRAQRAKRDATVKDNAPHMASALAIVAAATGDDTDTINALLVSRDPQTVELFDAALVEAKTRKGMFSNMEALANALQGADTNTQDKARELFAFLFAEPETETAMA